MVSNQQKSVVNPTNKGKIDGCFGQLRQDILFNVVITYHSRNEIFKVYTVILEANSVCI